MDRQLLEDGGLILTVVPEVADLVAPWIPRFSDIAPSAPTSAAGRIRVGVGSMALRLPDRPNPAIEVFGLRAWLDDSGRVTMRTRDATVAGTIDLPALQAAIEIVPDAHGQNVALDVFSSLTVASALLLSRQDRLLLHAASFVAPNGRAWLLVGDSHSGKSSTCANAIRLGWAFLADDQVVVGARADRSLWVEGWGRDFNLDVGFEDGASTGTRTPRDPTRVGSGAWQRSAPLGGIFFPNVDAGNPTVLTAVSEAGALQGLIRQSPWLLADPVAAPKLLNLLQTMIKTPTYRLGLGTDTYGDPDALYRALQPIVDSSEILVTLDPSKA